MPPVADHHVIVVLEPVTPFAVSVVEPVEQNEVTLPVAVTLVMAASAKVLTVTLASAATPQSPVTLA